MTDPRLTTVYDYSNLRLHPDGTRVYQKSSNLRPGLVKVTTQDPRSNWIAKDAGGSGTIRRSRKKVKDAPESSEEERDADIPAKHEELSEEADESESEGKKRKPKWLDKRKPKRQKFTNDFSYLEPEASSASSGIDGASTTEHGLPEPSADLLKCIHRFASEFYTERGQLLNISREFRKERKERTLRKRARRQVRGIKAHDGSVSPSGSESDPLDSEDVSHKGSEGYPEDDEDAEEESSDSEGSDRDEGKSRNKDPRGKGKAKPKRQRRRAEKLYTDMYKMFDGSAVMALGMLVQEQIAQILNPQIPEAWKEEIYKRVSIDGDLQGSTSNRSEIEEEVEKDDLTEDGCTVETRVSTDKDAVQAEESNREHGNGALESNDAGGGSRRSRGKSRSEVAESWTEQDGITFPNIPKSQYNTAAAIREPSDRAREGTGNQTNQPSFAFSQTSLNCSIASLDAGPDLDESESEDLTQSTSEESTRSEDTEESDPQDEID